MGAAAEPVRACCNVRWPAGSLAGGAWLVLTPRPLAGEPVVVAAIPPVAELLTASTTPAEDEGAADGGANPEEVIDQSAAEIRCFDDEAPRAAGLPGGSQQSSSRPAGR